MSLGACPKSIITREADILRSGYEDQAFDLIVCSQFLHHVHATGFRPFLQEFHRMLRRGGILAILEPSKLYPFSWITAMARRCLGNVTGLVAGERPINPMLLTRELKRAGFRRVQVRGLLFTHVRFPTLIQHLSDALDCPFRRITPFRLFAASVAWYCEKE